MPHGGFDDDYDGMHTEIIQGIIANHYIEPRRTRNRKSRVNDNKYGSSRHRRGSDDDSRDRGKGMQVAVRRKSKKYSDSEDEEPKKKSKSKSKKKSKKREASSDEDDDDDEVIVTKTAKYKDVDINDLTGEYLDALMNVFEVRPEKIDRWCHDGLIRLDNQTDMFDADKLIRLKASDDEKKEWDRYEKRYKRMMQEKKEMGEGRGGRGGPSRSNTVYVQVPPRREYKGCYDCWLLGRYCGHASY